MDSNIITDEMKEKAWKINLPVLWTAVFFCCVSYTACIPFLPMYLLQEIGVPKSEVNHWAGLVFAATFMGSSMMAPYWGALADYVGQRKMALRAGVGLTICYLLTGVCQNVYQLLLVRAFTGIIAGFVPACMSMASSSLPQHRMGQGMGLMQTSLASGTIMGPLIGGYLSSWFGMRASFYMGGAGLFLATLGIAFIVKDMTVVKKGDYSATSLLADLKESLNNKELRYTMSMFFVIQACIMLIQPLITLYVGDLMGTMGNEVVEMSGVIFSIGGLAGILAAPFWGKRGQKHGYVRIFCVVLFSAGMLELLQPLIRDVYQFAGLQFIIGLFIAGAIPNINANVTKVTDANTRGKAFGLLTSAQQFGGVVGPLAGSVLGVILPTPYVLVTVGFIWMSTAVFSYMTRVKN